MEITQGVLAKWDEYGMAGFPNLSGTDLNDEDNEHMFGLCKYSPPFEIQPGAELILPKCFDLIIALLNEDVLPAKVTVSLHHNPVVDSWALVLPHRRPIPFAFLPDQIGNDRIACSFVLIVA
jgi:hypothetical protein